MGVSALTPVLSAVLLAPYYFPAWPLPEGDVAKLKAGQTLHKDFEDDGLKGAILRFFVKAEPAFVYKTLSNVEEMPKYMPSLGAIKVLEVKGSMKRLEYHSQLPLVPDFILDRYFEPPRRIWWTKHKAAYKRIEGSWDITPAEGGTIIQYSLAVETGGLLPSWAALEIQKQGGRDLVRNVTRHIESGGKWIRPDYKP
jgi:ribosome-associated toxin RatA of RatAB toxin-antitoxin module